MKLNKKILRSVIVIIRTIKGKSDNKNYMLHSSISTCICSLLLWAWHVLGSEDTAVNKIKPLLQEVLE